MKKRFKPLHAGDVWLFVVNKKKIIFVMQPVLGICDFFVQIRGSVPDYLIWIRIRLLASVT
jgi:hypothetical protein